MPDYMERTLANAMTYDAECGSMLDDMIAHGLLYEAARNGDHEAAKRLLYVESHMRCNTIRRKAIPGEPEWGSSQQDIAKLRGLTAIGSPPLDA